MRVHELAKRFAPGKARWYPKLRRYIKRLEVVLAEVGVVELLIILKAQRFGWHHTTLISTLKTGVQEVFKAWSARWSLEVSCETQEEVNEYWEKLSAVPESEQCGWLKDRYGVSWQIIPTALPILLSDPDPEKAGRVMEAMLKMKKIDIEKLKRVYDEQGTA